MTKTNDIVSEIIGDWGPWQFRTVFLIYLCKIPAAWFMAVIIFTAPIPNPGEVYCYQPEQEVQSVANVNGWTNQTFPSIIIQKNSNLNDVCTKFNPTYDEATVSNSSFVNDERTFESVPCRSIQFNTTFETTITKFSLVCSRSILIATSQFFHLFGVLTGGILATKLMET